MHITPDFSQIQEYKHGSFDGNVFLCSTFMECLEYLGMVPDFQCELSNDLIILTCLKFLKDVIVYQSLPQNTVHRNIQYFISNHAVYTHLQKNVRLVDCPNCSR